MVIVDYLTAQGFEVVDVSNASDAIAVLDTSRTRIDALFTDIDMPGGPNGLELAATVHRRWPSVSIAVTSGHRIVAPGDLPLGAVFFPKPYDCRKVAAGLRA